MKDRIFLPNVPHHCYQRSVDHGVLFYSKADYLLFFTLYCTIATRHEVHVLKLALMPDHFHHCIQARTQQQFTDFARDFSALLTREYNRAYGRSGPLLETPFSSAPKRGDKAIRTNLIYLDNNPVERKLVSKAEDYRWNFLAYGASDHPFSERIVLRRASMPLRRALKRVKYLHENGQYLSICVLNGLFESITLEQEKEQLIDFIIRTYSVIDHPLSHRYFNGYEQEVLAAHANTGSEYDINEVFIGKSDTCYALLTKTLLKEGCVQDIHEILHLTLPEKHRLATLLQRKTWTPWRQIAAFLHLPVGVNA